MNRILQAEVILTLTLDQAEEVLKALRYDRAIGSDVLGAVMEQCAKQGVEL